MTHEKVECPECGEGYKKLGLHWYHNESHRPKLTKQQKEIVTGLMMSDGCLNREEGGNNCLVVEMITKKYLEELDEIFGCLSTGVKLKEPADKRAKRNRESGFHLNADEENYHDIWYWQTRSLPELHEFDWYTSDEGEKVWPKNIELTPTVLTHLYVGDGSWQKSKSNNNIRITLANEFGNKDKIDSYFKSANLPTPSDYAGEKDIVFTIGDSHTLWEYMDSPPSGFEYKFPPEYR